jgi:hypothetical protein
VANRVGMQWLFNSGALRGVAAGIPNYLGGDGVIGCMPPAARK